MAILPYQFSVGTGTGTLVGTLVTVPAGASGVTFFVPGTSTVYLGGTNVGTSNGYPVVGGAAAVTIPLNPAAKQTVLYALASAVNTPIGVIISTDT